MQLYGVILPGRVPEAQPPAAPAAQQPLQPLEHQARPQHTPGAHTHILTHGRSTPAALGLRARGDRAQTRVHRVYAPCTLSACPPA